MSLRLLDLDELQYELRYNIKQQGRTIVLMDRATQRGRHLAMVRRIDRELWGYGNELQDEIRRRTNPLICLHSRVMRWWVGYGEML